MQEQTKFSVDNYITDNTIKIPNKLHKVLDHLSVNDLKKINKDITVAKELCLYFTSMIIRSVIKENKMCEMSSKLFSDILGSNYRRIVDVLLKGTPQKGPIIIVDESYKVDDGNGGYSKHYGFTKAYLKGIQTYKITTEYVRNIIRQYRINKLNDIKDNIIFNNLLNFYKHLNMPTYEQVEEYCKHLAKQKATNKKGKIITVQHRQKKSHWKDANNRIFVEDILFQYEYFYSLNGLMMPKQGSDNAGGRVYDSITAIPSVIRDLFKYDGEDMIELDYKCLHPNLAMQIYGGNKKYITHKEVADFTNKNINKVKKQHLSFFNVKKQFINKYDIYDFYKDDKTFIDALYDDKKVNHKITSKKMLTLEVAIMTDVIKQLNDKGIYVAYIFDALLCCKKDKSIVTKIMNETILKHGVYTSVDGTIIGKLSETQNVSEKTEIADFSEDNEEDNEYNDINNIYDSLKYERNINIKQLEFLKDWCLQYKDSIKRTALHDQFKYLAECTIKDIKIDHELCLITSFIKSKIIPQNIIKENTYNIITKESINQTLKDLMEYE